MARRRRVLAVLLCLLAAISSAAVMSNTKPPAARQIPPFLGITKTCPSQPLQPGSAFMCTFTVQNEDAANAVINLTFTNTFPFPGGSSVAALCTVGGNPVTTLQPLGTQGDTCSGVLEETAPACDPAGHLILVDQVTADGWDTGGFPVSGAASADVQILGCPPPTPTNTPTKTPVPQVTSTPPNTPTITATNTLTSTATPASTGTPTPVPVVPTLDERGMLVFGLLVACAGLLLIRIPRS